MKECKYCGGTGFAFGNIPCVCVEDESVVGGKFKTHDTGKALEKACDAITAFSVAMQDFTVNILSFKITYDEIIVDMTLSYEGKLVNVLDKIADAGFRVTSSSASNVTTYKDIRAIKDMS